MRWDCIGRYGGLAMFWHDQTKVGNYDAAIRIPDRLYDVLAERQRKTLDRFTARYGYGGRRERAGLALFPTTYRSNDGTVPLTHQWFYSRFRPWVDAMDLGHYVPHQARHTLATSLLRHGATLTYIRRYLGQVSDRMAEHYVHLSHSDLENVLQHVWVAGPGTASPGEFLAGTAAPLSQAEAQALAVDLSRRSTPAEGGFCTFQPVVDGGACPWNLARNCDKFVLSGANLVNWRRKREQWRLLAEGAPDDATASYLHDYFEPTARAIDGLEKALAGLGLLDDALALDLRKPQDYFQRVWNTAFLASDLARAGRKTTTGPGTANPRRRMHEHEPRRPGRVADCGRTGGPAHQRPGRAAARSRRPRPDAAREDAGHRGLRRRRASVSRTFLYSNPEARTAVADAAAASGLRQAADLTAQDTGQEATWRQRALNAEDAVKAAHAEILQQRTRLGELLGQVRDLQAEWTEGSIQRITTENTTLQQRVRQLTTDNRTLDERLKAARSNMRFQDRRLADLEAQIAGPSAGS